MDMLFSLKSDESIYAKGDPVKQKSLLKMIHIALGIAIIAVATLVLQVPVPLGYVNLGEVFILLLGFLFGPLEAGICAGIGAMFGDFFTGYVYWMPITFLTKGLEGALCGMLLVRVKKKELYRSPYVWLSGIVLILMLNLGYVIGGAILYSSLAVSLTQVPSLVVQGAVGFGGFLALLYPISKLKGKL